MTDFVILDNLKRGRHIGCPSCMKERNGLIVYRDNIDQKLHMRFKSLILRCTNPGTHGYNTYKDREIYKQWLDSPIEFIKYVRSLPNFDLSLTLDRIDNNKGYVPNNIRWATPEEQSNNREDTIYVNYNNKKFPLKVFTKLYSKFSYERTSDLIKMGVSPEECTVRNSYHTDRTSI